MYIVLNLPRVACVPIVGRMLAAGSVASNKSYRAVSPLAAMCKSTGNLELSRDWAVERVRHIIGRVTLYTHILIYTTYLRIFSRSVDFIDEHELISRI